MPIISITQNTMYKLQTMYKWGYTTVEAQQLVPFDDYVEEIIKKGIAAVEKEN